MSLSGAAMRYLSDCGLSIDQIAQVSDLNRAASSSDDAKERKRAADRERIAARREAERKVRVAKEVAEVSRDVAATHSEGVAIVANVAATSSDIPSCEPTRVVIPFSSSLRSEEVTQVQELTVPSPTPIPKKPKSPGKKTICPTDWKPTDSHFAKATKHGLSRQQFADAEERFREWEFKDGKTDFDLAFHRWLRTTAEDLGTQNGTGTQSRTNRWQAQSERKASQLIEGTLDFVNRGRER